MYACMHQICDMYACMHQICEMYAPNMQALWRQALCAFFFVTYMLIVNIVLVNIVIAGILGFRSSGSGFRV